jgi:hypothetical protein
MVAGCSGTKWMQLRTLQLLYISSYGNQAYHGIFLYSHQLPTHLLNRSSRRSHIIWQDQSLVPSCVYELNPTQKAYYTDSLYAIGQLNTMARAQHPASTSILYQVWLSQKYAF